MSYDDDPFKRVKRSRSRSIEKKVVVEAKISKIEALKARFQ